MITIIFAIIIIIVGVGISCVSYDEEGSVGLAIALGIGTTSVATIISFMILVVAASFFTTYTVSSVESKPIVALQDNITTSGEIRGEIFYTTGYIDSELSYFYLTSTDSGLKSEHIPADSAYIKTSDTPRLEITYSNYELSWIGKLLFFPIEANHTKIQNYTLYIPEESITNSFSIDLEN